MANYQSALVFFPGQDRRGQDELGRDWGDWGMGWRDSGGRIAHLPGDAVRHANRQTEAAARYAFLEAYGQLNTAIANNKDTSSVFRRGLSGEGLDDDESMQFFSILGQWLNTWSVMYDLHIERQLPDGQWFLVRADIHSALSTVGGRAFWDGLATYAFQSRFVAMVDALLDGDGASYNILNIPHKPA